MFANVVGRLSTNHAGDQAMLDLSENSDAAAASFEKEVSAVPAEEEPKVDQGATVTEEATIWGSLPLVSLDHVPSAGSSTSSGISWSTGESSLALATA